MSKFKMRVAGTFGNGTCIKKWIEEYLKTSRIESAMIKGVFITPSGSGAMFSIHHLEDGENGPECIFALIEESSASKFFQAIERTINKNGAEKLINSAQCRCADWTYIWVGFFEK